MKTFLFPALIGSEKVANSQEIVPGEGPVQPSIPKVHTLTNTNLAPRPIARALCVAVLLLAILPGLNAAEPNIAEVEGQFRELPIEARQLLMGSMPVGSSASRSGST